MDDVQLSHEAGYIELFSSTHIRGWLFKGSTPGKERFIQLKVDDVDEIQVAVDVDRPDVASAGYSNSKVGFYLALPKRYNDRDHQIAFLTEAGAPLYLKDARTGRVFCTATIYPVVNETPAHLAAIPDKLPPAETAVVYIDQIDESGIQGWATVKSKPFTPVSLDFLVDGEYFMVDGDRIKPTVCNLRRDDVTMQGYPSPLVGFSIKIPAAFFDDEPHELTIESADGQVIKIVTEQRPLGARLVFQFPRYVFLGRADGLHDGAMRGWCLRHDRKASQFIGGQDVLITMTGHPIAQVTANHFRADVGQAMKADPNCGFVFVPPEDIVSGKQIEFQFKTIPGLWELDNSPTKAMFPDHRGYKTLHELIETADALFTQMWKLRARLKTLLPAPYHNLNDYDMWARDYFKRLKLPNHDDAIGLLKTSTPPLVSIVCPVYLPRLKDFEAAVNSILCQSYQNWELIIADDGSESAELTACLEKFSLQDSRIRIHTCNANSGISKATNAALALARGTYIAFFDHDDLMVDCAIEILVDAALRTGAKLLYCDEDKVDDDGTYSEVNLKPDWNYRLLLCQNYICHILFVEHQHLKKAGLLKTKYDGAQDHDLVLRLSEITPPEQIHHVPKILYHWRKTPNSTSGSAKTKPYAIQAGIRAVTDHLARRKLTGRVTSLLDATIYTIDWKLNKIPSVTILIPYRDHIEMTRNCVTALRENTDYKNYEIILLDNWSTSDEAAEFAAEQSSQPGTKVIRIEERFNFSRINNIGVAISNAEYILLLNNDVIVSQSNWLTQMMGEAMADPLVGVVGNKLLYPNGLVQHGGIILGVGGVGDHAHRGLGAKNPGYMARAICAQDMSAVTAACLLCRREVYNSVGGFDEVDLTVAFNDVDFCLKVAKAGYRIVWTPGSTAEHLESLSRGNDFKPEHQTRFFHENKVMQERWRGVLENDPFYNENFSRQSGIFFDLKQTNEQR